MTESYEEVLARKKVLVFTPGGTSMQPLLKHHENPVVLVPVDTPLRKLDVILYKRAGGQYVLHRIIKVTKKGYVCCGDNQTTPEKGVMPDMVIARMVGFYKDGEYIDAQSAEMKKYARRRVWSIPLRALKIRLRSVTGKRNTQK